MSRRLKIILALFVITATFVGFGWYLVKNPQIREQLLATSPLVIASIVALYMLSVVALAATLGISLRFFSKAMPKTENFLLTSYSTLVNFFGPAQSGPGVRAVYLKLKYQVSFKQFIFVTLLYYAWFATASGLMLISPIVSWWQALLVGLILAGGCYVLIRYYTRKHHSTTEGAATALPRFLPLMGWLGVAVLLQIIFIMLAYFVELRAVDSSVSLMQAVSYAGAANFALFVALTPGAIGFREAFLVFSQDIHGISQDTIIAASVLDRAVYLVVLGLLFVIVLSTHAGQKFKTYNTARKAKALSH